MAYIRRLEVVTKSEHAILFQQKQGRGNYVQSWIPKSQIDYQKTIDDLTEIQIPDWLAEKSEFTEA